MSGRRRWRWGWRRRRTHLIRKWTVHVQSPHVILSSIPCSPALGVNRLLQPGIAPGEEVDGLGGAIGNTSLNSVEQVHVGHGIGIARVDIEGYLQHSEAVF